MLFIFPLIYIASFIVALKEVLNGKHDGVLTFIIWGLPLYLTAISVAFTLGLKEFIPTFQSFKEILILITLILNIIALKTRPRLHIIDYLVLGFFVYTFIYALLPIGEQGLINRLTAFKSISFFVLVYFAGRLTNTKAIFINKYFSYVVVLTIGAAIVTLIESATKTPLQFISGYFDYSYYFYNLDADGAFGLAATFNSDSGLMRFASFFTSPLEHAGATLLALAIILSLYTKDNNKFRFNNLSLLALGATFISIILSFSRAPLASYCIIIYVYALITKRKLIINIIHTGFVIAAIYITYLFIQFENNHTGVIAVVLNTIDFSDPSSIGHLEQWAEGIAAIAQSPFGLGMGTSGRVAASTSENIGGENQYIILAVQAGLLAATLYLAMFVMLVKVSIKWLPRLKGKAKKVCMAVLLIKIGFFISTLTSEIESSTYLSYMNWFLSGLLISFIMEPNVKQNIPVYDH